MTDGPLGRRVGGALALACLLSACAQEVANPYVVTETMLEVGAMRGGAAVMASEPAIEVRRADGTALLRDAWIAAEAAARAHCAGQGAAYSRLPPSRDHTDIRLDDGTFYFMAVCAG